MDKKKIEYSEESFNTIKELKEIVVGFAEMSGLALSFDDFTGQNHWISSTLSMSNFCRMLKDTSIGIESCKHDYYEHSKQMASNGETIIYKCHAGLWKFSIPVMFRHSAVAAICGGQFRPPDFNINTLDKLANELSLDKTKLTKSFNNLKVLTKSDFQKIISSLEYLAQKIVRSAERQRVIEEMVQFKWLLESSNWTPKDILKQIKDRCRELVGGIDHGCILQRDPDSGKVTNVAPCPKGGTNCVGEKAGCEGIDLAIKNKEAILVKDAQSDPRYNKGSGPEGTRSKIVAPIMRNEDVIGVINLNSLSPNSLDESDKELIQLLTPLAGVAIKSAEQIDTLKSLYDVALSLSSAHDLPNVLIEIVQHLKHIINADVVVLYPYDKEIENFAYKPFKDGVISNEKQMILSGKCERIVKSISQKKGPYFADNVEGDKELDNKFARTEGIKSSAGVPLIFEKDIMGALFVNFRNAHHFTEEDRRLIKMFGSLSSVAINRIQLQKRLTRDEKLAAMGKITAEMAHGIGNPLGIINSTIENLLDEKGSIKKKRLDIKLKKIFVSVFRINEIKERILKPLRPFKKLNSANINSEISNAIELLKNEGLLRDDINIQTLLDDVPQLLLDSSEIREVFLSLIRNSVNAMPDGGVLKIETHYSEKDQNIEIIIEDTGFGIPEDIVDKIFEPFETTTVGGTGLGLSISYESIKSYDGDISVKSEKGKGTSFVVTLPLNEKTRGTESLGFAVEFFDGLIVSLPEREKIRELTIRFDDALDKAKTSIDFATKDIENKLKYDFETARKMFYKKGNDVKIVGGKMVIRKDYVVNDNFEIVDEIRDSLKDARATIFQLVGSEAVRIATNELNKDETRAINTVVSQPVYRKVVRDKMPFTGRAWVVNEWKVTRYEPIYDVNREVIGMLYIGVPERHPQILEKLNKKISSIRLSNGGYVFILDDKGKVLIHPYLPEGSDFSNYKFYKEELERRKGWMDATYQSGDRTIREIIHYHQFSAWNWTICAACPKEEILDFLKGVKT